MKTPIFIILLFLGTIVYSQNYKCFPQNLTTYYLDELENSSSVCAIRIDSIVIHNDITELFGYNMIRGLENYFLRKGVNSDQID
ncbi:MAG TPA: hypothetical protein DDX39_07525, partial [Bacteroidales bacterium]|nr:hypothetical protein [Bacteroidales bacterium]